MALQDRAGNVTAHLDRLLKTGAMPPADRGLAREIALGALRHRGTLEAIRRAFLKQPGKRLAGAVDEITLVALYQMLFLSRVPSHAAVNEAVNQAARFHHRRQTSFINGLLRSILRETQAPAKPPAPAPAAADNPAGPGRGRGPSPRPRRIPPPRPKGRPKRRRRPRPRPKPRSRRMRKPRPRRRKRPRRRPKRRPRPTNRPK